MLNQLLINAEVNAQSFDSFFYYFIYLFFTFNTRSAPWENNGFNSWNC